MKEKASKVLGGRGTWVSRGAMGMGSSSQTFRWERERGGYGEKSIEGGALAPDRHWRGRSGVLSTERRDQSALF